MAYIFPSTRILRKWHTSSPPLSPLETPLNAHSWRRDKHCLQTLKTLAHISLAATELHRSLPTLSQCRHRYFPLNCWNVTQFYSHCQNTDTDISPWTVRMLHSSLLIVRILTQFFPQELLECWYTVLFSLSEYWHSSFPQELLECYTVLFSLSEYRHSSFPWNC